MTHRTASTAGTDRNDAPSHGETAAGAVGGAESEAGGVEDGGCAEVTSAGPSSPH